MFLKGAFINKSQGTVISNQKSLQLAFEVFEFDECLTKFRW